MQNLFKYLLSERGEVGQTEEPTDPPVEQTEEKGEEGTDGKEESFLTQEEIQALPPEIRNSKDFKSMQAAFTRRMQEFRNQKDKLEAHDRFFSDPEYAKEVISTMAPRLGLSLGNGQPPATKPVDKAPPEYVEAVRANLSPELQWMAEQQANATWAAVKQALAPIQSQREKETQERLLQEYEQQAEALTEKFPGWEEREKDMLEALEFLNSKKLQHPKFGSKLEMLLNVVTGNQAAEVAATRRMRDTARNRSSQSRTTTTTTENLLERVRDRKISDQEAFQIAAKAAADQIQRGR